MAQIQAEKSLVERVARILGYSGTGLYQPMSVLNTNTSILTQSGNQAVRAKIFRGWPITNQLDTDLTAGISTITISPIGGMMRLLNLYVGSPSYISSCTPVLLTTSVSGNTVTYAGSTGAGIITGVATGVGIIRTAYAIRCVAGDTPSTVATKLSSIIPGSSTVGPVLTIPNSRNLEARTAGDFTINQELNYVSQQFNIGIWSPSVMARDSLVNALMTGIVSTPIFSLLDGSYSRNSYYRGYWPNDATQPTEAWQANLRWEVEFPILKQSINPGILFIGIELNNVKTVGDFAWTNTDPAIG